MDDYNRSSACPKSRKINRYDGQGVFFTGRGGAGAWVGTGAENVEKDSPPQAIEWGAVGKRARGRRFSGSGPPVTKSMGRLEAPLE